MTINDFLIEKGFGPLTRDLESKTTMLVKNYDDTKWGKIQPYPCTVMEKKDGVCSLVVNISGDVAIFSRTGRRMMNVKHLEDYYKQSFDLTNRVLCVEICHDGLSLEQISGIVNPNRVEALEPALEETWLEESYGSAFDMIYLDEFIKGESENTFEQRLGIMKLVDLNLCIPIHFTNADEAMCDYFFKQIESQGGEGVVQCLPRAVWKAGYKNHAKTKKVRGVDFDLEVTGVVEGKGKRAGTMAKLVVRWRHGGVPEGRVAELAVDGRFDDATRALYWSNPSRIIGRIVHVHALQIGSKGSLRLAKVRCVRNDKQEADL